MSNVLMRTLFDGEGMVRLVPCEPAFQLKIFRENEQSLLTTNYYLDENDDLYFLLERGLHSIKELSSGWRVVIAVDFAIIFRTGNEYKPTRVYRIPLNSYYCQNSVANLFLNILLSKQELSNKVRRKLIMILISRPEINSQCFRIGHSELFLNKNFRFLFKHEGKKYTGVLTTFKFFEVI